MRFEALIPWWIAVPVFIALAAIIGWELFKVFRKTKRISLIWLRRLMLALFMLLFSFGPSVPSTTSSPGVANLDVLFLVDTTASMGAEDYAGRDGNVRLSGVKNDLLALGEALKGAHIGLITFDSKANTALAFTPDGATFSSAVKSLQREIHGTSKGSNIDKPFELAKEQLQARKDSNPERSRLIFYLGDGEQTSEDEVKPFTDIKAFVEGGAVMGYGTAEGAKMRKFMGLDDMPRSENDSDYINTPDPDTKQFVPAISKIDTNALQKIADDMGVAYQDRNSGGSVTSLIKDSNAEVLIDKGRKVVHYLQIYWLLAMPIGLLVFWEWKNVLLLFLEVRKMRRASRE